MNEMAITQNGLELTLDGQTHLVQKVKLWPWERTTAWRHVKEVMESPGLG